MLSNGDALEGGDSEVHTYTIHFDEVVTYECTIDATSEADALGKFHNGGDDNVWELDSARDTKSIRVYKAEDSDDD